jgi:hypothetical protein
MKTFSVDYRYEGTTFSIQMKAADWAEAERRLEAISDFGKITGEVIETGPIAGGFTQVGRA